VGGTVAGAPAPIVRGLRRCISPAYPNSRSSLVQQASERGHHSVPSQRLTMKRGPAPFVPSRVEPSTGRGGWAFRPIDENLPNSRRIELARLGKRNRKFADSLLEGAGFEPVWGFSCQVVIFGLLAVLCSEVCPGKASMFSRRQSCRGKSQSPVVWIAEEMETEPSKPIDKISRGESTSHRAVSKENALWPRKK